MFLRCFCLLPAEKGGLRTGDVSESVCLSVCLLQFWISIEFHHGYVWAHSDWPIREQGMNVKGLADQSGFFIWISPWLDRPIREQGVGVLLMIDQSELLGNFTMQGYIRGVTSVDMSVWLMICQTICGYICLSLIFSAGLSTSVLVHWQSHGTTSTNPWRHKLKLSGDS